VQNRLHDCSTVTANQHLEPWEEAGAAEEGIAGVPAGGRNDAAVMWSEFCSWT